MAQLDDEQPRLSKQANAVANLWDKNVLHDHFDIERKTKANDVEDEKTFEEHSWFLELCIYDLLSGVQLVEQFVVSFLQHDCRKIQIIKDVYKFFETTIHLF